MVYIESDGHSTFFFSLFICLFTFCLGATAENAQDLLLAMHSKISSGTAQNAGD